jgi:hypothetical protein
MPVFVEMLVTAALPLVVIGAGVATLFAIKHHRTRTAVTTTVVALVAFGACVWVYFAVLTR